VQNFVQQETFFYLAMFAAAGIGNISRCLSDNERLDWRGWVGRTLAAGVAGGGSVAYWVTYHSGSSGVTAWLFVFASFAIGYTFIDVRDLVIKTLIRWILKKVGADDEKRDEPHAD
jgi:hypothetical protein